jgi:hypothetical protein
MVNFEINKNNYLSGLTRFAGQVYLQGSKDELLHAFLDSNTQGQIESKLQILSLLRRQNFRLNSALFIGQWHGLLPFLCFREELIKSGVGIEISNIWSQISQGVNFDWNWTSHCADATLPETWKLLSENGNKFDIVINTSTEHMSYEWLNYLPAEQLVLIQSSDYKIDQHTNRETSIEDLVKSTQLSHVFEKSVLELPIYNRFTLLGKK